MGKRSPGDERLDVVGVVLKSLLSSVNVVLSQVNQNLADNWDTDALADIVDQYITLEDQIYTKMNMVKQALVAVLGKSEVVRKLYPDYETRIPNMSFGELVVLNTLRNKNG